MPHDGIHVDTLSDNIEVAQEHPTHGNWAGRIVKQPSHLAIAKPLLSSGLYGLNFLGLQEREREFH